MNDKITVKVGQGTSIKIEYTKFYKEDDGIYTVRIPALNITFCSPTKEGIKEREDFMMDSFMEYWVEDKSLKDFILKIHKLGFRSKSAHNLVVSNFVKGKAKNASLSANVVGIKGFHSEKMVSTIAA